MATAPIKSSSVPYRVHVIGTEHPVPIYGPRAYKVNKRQVLKKGYRIFRAHMSCGCCTVDMAFYSLNAVKIQFEEPMFADVVRDDQGHLWDCINTYRGFKEIKYKTKPVVPVQSSATKNTELSRTVNQFPAIAA